MLAMLLYNRPLIFSSVVFLKLLLDNLQFELLEQFESRLHL